MCQQEVGLNLARTCWLASKTSLWGSSSPGFLDVAHAARGSDAGQSEREGERVENKAINVIGRLDGGQSADRRRTRRRSGGEQRGCRVAGGRSGVFRPLSGPLVEVKRVTGLWGPLAPAPQHSVCMCLCVSVVILSLQLCTWPQDECIIGPQRVEMCTHALT